MKRDAGSTRVLAVSSAGGHWVQLRRLRPAWDGCAVTYVTTNAGYRDEVLADATGEGQSQPGFVIVPDATIWQKFRLFYLGLAMVAIVLRVWPHVIVTTGAAPGFFALWIGKLLGARTIWVDSITNAGELSSSGRKVRSCADLWLTQWKHLAKGDGKRRVPLYRGSVF
jgi:hypothetical protein